MKRFRSLLIVLVLLCCTTPLFALPPCAFCLDESTCEQSPGTGTRCRVIGGVCTETFGACIGFRGQNPALSESYTVASVEVRQQRDVVTQPSVATASLATPKPAHH